MNRTTALLAAILAALASPSMAQDDGALVTFQVMTPETALKAAQATMQACRDEGFQVGVSVVDRFGVTQVFLRDRFAGLHVEETAYRKAWTAISFRGPTLELDAAIQPGTMMAGIRDLSVALPLGGGVPVEAAGSIVGAIGVSGAPSPEADDICARAGIDAILFDLEF
jgi:uncharacterized protein GlcG (DUF336 family)